MADALFVEYHAITLTLSDQRRLRRVDIESLARESNQQREVKHRVQLIVLPATKMVVSL